MSHTDKIARRVKALRAALRSAPNETRAAFVQRAREDLAECQAQLALAKAWGAQLAEEVEALRRLSGVRRLQPMPGGKPYEDGTSVIYFLHCVDGTTKIGLTRVLPSRLRRLRGASGGKHCELLSVIRGTAADESRFHEIHALRRVSNEWFALEQEHIPPTEFDVQRFNADVRRRSEWQRVCIRCGTPFVAKMSYQLCCHRRCGRVAPAAQKACTDCAVPFVAHGNRKRCGPCAQRAKQRRRLTQRILRKYKAAPR